MNCFEDGEDAPVLMATGVSTVLNRLIQSNQARLVQWHNQQNNNRGMNFNLQHSTVGIENCKKLGEGNEVVGVVGGGVQGIIASAGKPTRFDSAYIPDITIEDYVERIQTYSKCSASVYVVAMIYIDRLIEGQGLVVTHLNVHRLFITAILVAAKFYDDLSFKNAFYATLGGIEKTEMNLLEVDFLNMIKFSLVVERDSYVTYKSHLLSDYPDLGPQNFWSNVGHMDGSFPVAAPYSPMSVTHQHEFGVFGTTGNVNNVDKTREIFHGEIQEH